MSLAQNYRALMSHVPSLLWLWGALPWNIFLSYNLQDPCPFHLNSYEKRITILRHSHLKGRKQIVSAVRNTSEL